MVLSIYGILSMVSSIESFHLTRKWTRVKHSAKKLELIPRNSNCRSQAFVKKKVASSYSSNFP